jgi:4-hydroxy-tetrahydrodipicolinate synthase
MITAPYYLLPSDKDLIYHFNNIAENTELPITVYNNPFRSGVNMNVALLVELSKMERVVTVKQSSKEFMELIDLIRLTENREDFFVTNGQETRAFPSFLMGAEASYGVSPLLLGQECIAMYDCAQKGDIERGKYIQFKVNKIRSAIAACRATPAAVLKELVNSRGLAGGYYRAPITELSDEDRKRLHEMSAEVGIQKV